MTRTQARGISQKGTEAQRSRLPEGTRERLLAGMPVTESRLQLAGVSTAVLEGGAGPPVVLLHGPGEYAAKWMLVIPDLVTTHRVVAPDLPGHGTSEVTEGPVDADRVLAWLGELIEATCVSPPALVGPRSRWRHRGPLRERPEWPGQSAGTRGRAWPGSVSADAGVRARLG